MLWTSPVAIGAALVLVEPDIGTTSVIVSVAYVMLAVAGLSKKRLAQSPCSEWSYSWVT